jgi:hypothetical protein
MGLAVVHGIVTGHGGALAVESAVGRGTRIEVLIPRVEDVTVEEPLAVADAGSRAASAARVTVGQAHGG